MSDKYSGEFKGFNPDELIGDTYEPLTVQNVKVGTTAEIKRGELLAGASATDTFKTATAADTSKVLVIARENFVADSECFVTSAYSNGVFNREKLVTGTSDTTVIDALELEMRRQGLRLTGLREV